ncbi:MAG: hypothetical protein ACK4TA_15645 [Saprospiraceae bacterium]
MFAKTFVAILFILGLFCKNLEGQPPVLLLQNPSFEDVPGFSRPPRGWFYCGEFGETPPDIHPYNAMYGVTHEAKDGYTYVGMVVRDNNTWEGLSQWLAEPLEAGQCYQFSLYTARSPYYQSVSRTTWKFVNFDHPVVLRLWGGNLHCEKAELLAVSPPVAATDWQRYTFAFQATKPYNRLVIEAYYESEQAPYCGNVLLDAASPVLPVHCNTGEPLVNLEKIELRDDLTDAQIAALAQQITFSDVDQQLEEHAFYLPSGELYQANKPLYLLVQILKNTPERKLVLYLNEDQKRFFKKKSASLFRALYGYGLQSRQFRIQKYRPHKNEPDLQLEVLLELQ